jgi:DNA repair exonuclease SbcCD ATPase subunit
MPKFSPEAMQWLLQQTPSQTIYEIVKGSGDIVPFILHGGFQLTSKSFENSNLRLRLSALLLREADLLEAFLGNERLMRSWRTVSGVMEMLDGDWLKKNWRALLRTVADPRPLVLGMFWAGKKLEDEKLERLSRRLFACPSLWKEADSSRQNAGLADSLKLFALTKQPAAAPDSSKKQTNLTKKLEQEAASLRKALEQSRKESKQQRHASEAEQQQWRQKYANLERELKDREKHWQKLYQQLEANAEEVSKQEIAAFEQRVLGLQPGQEAELEDIRNHNAALQERIAKVLQLQAANNRRFGLRQALRQEISELEAQLQSIQQAIDESVVIYEDLPELQIEVEARITQLKEQLNEQDLSQFPEDIPNRMKLMIKTVRLDENAAKTFSEIRQFLEHDSIRRILYPEELQATQKLLEEQRKKHNHIISSRNANTASQTHTGEIWFLTQHIQNLHRTSLYVDGCNLLLCDPQWKELTEKKGQATARADLIEKCKSKAALFKNIHLIFDGIESQDSIEKLESGLTLHFAARKASDQNADNYLVQLMKETPKQSQELRWVVTKDSGLRTRVAHLCDAIVPNQSFAKFLRIS